jgi:UDP:flavonoid glycosyltransferase YjiC (YdhE family)
MAHFLLLPVGSHGDVHPYVGIGKHLRGRGHSVTMITSEPFRGVAERHGFDFVPTFSNEDYSGMMHHPDLWHPRKGMRVILDREQQQRVLPLAFDAIRQRYVPGSSVAVGSVLSFAARIAHDALRIPFATVHLQPMACCSLSDPPVTAAGTDWSWLPQPLIRFGYWFAEATMTDPLIAPFVNSFRSELGLPPVRRILTHWAPSPQCVIGLFPDWLASISDGGPRFHHAGFSFFDDAGGRPTPDHLRQFLASGPPPLIFSFGSAMQHARSYFSAAVEACRLLGARGVLLGASGGQIPRELPVNVCHADYAPFSEVFPQAACVVHHGGIGTSAQALRAGVPQLVMPLAYDQADNGTRLRRLGVATLLFPRRFKAPAVARQLKVVLENKSFCDSARELRVRLQESDGASAAGTYLERLLH